jgi:hypothetical protein
LRDSNILREVLDYGAKADIILVSVAKEDRQDFDNTRLGKILENFESRKQYFIDWQSPNPNANTVELDQLSFML